jgi:hypothetical protein
MVRGVRGARREVADDRQAAPTSRGIDGSLIWSPPLLEIRSVNHLGQFQTGEHVSEEAHPAGCTAAHDRGDG